MGDTWEQLGSIKDWKSSTPPQSACGVRLAEGCYALRVFLGFLLAAVSLGRSGFDWGSDVGRSRLRARSGLSVEIGGPGAFSAFEALFAFGLLGGSPFASCDGVAWLCRLARAFLLSAESVLDLCLLAALVGAGLSGITGGTPVF